MQNKKKLVVFLLGSIMALGPFSIDMYLPAFQSIADALDTDTASVGYSLTSFFAGLLFGQLFYGILIDRYGRKRPLIIGLTIFMLATIGCAFAPSLDLLIGFRFLMAIGGCAGMVISRAVVRDVFPANDIAKVFSQLMLVMGVAPLIAPSIGGLVNSWFGWRWIFGTILLIAIAIMAMVVFVLKETREGDDSISLKPGSIWSEYAKVFKHKSFLIYALAGSFSYAGLFAYIAGSPAIFMEKFGFTDTEYGWAFSFNAFGLIMGSQINRLVLKRRDELSASKWSVSLLTLVGLVLLVSSYLGVAGAVLTLCCTFTYLFLLGVLNPNSQALALKPFTREAGRGSAMLGSIQMGAGVFTSWMVSFLHDGTSPNMAIVMLGCAAISMTILFLAKEEPKEAHEEKLMKEAA